MQQAIEAQHETRILVVDDSDLMRRSLRTLLEGTDHWKVCDEASNGQEAVTKFSNEKFDVVVLDFQMPVMDGLEAARQITVRSPESRRETTESGAFASCEATGPHPHRYVCRHGLLGHRGILHHLDGCRDVACWRDY
ncbi:MAG: response regulator [Candidatus Sulfotelmatobacter sp.]